MSEVKYQNDLNLLHKYLCGDRKAGEELFASAYVPLRNFVYDRTKSDTALTESDKDDIIIESMLRVVEKLHLYNGTSLFKNFVIGHAKNLIKEQRRKKSKDHSKITTIDEEKYVDNYFLSNNPLDILIRREKIQAVHKALLMLSEDQKNIIILRAFNDMPFKQVSTLIGKSEDAVDSLYRRGIKAFKINFNKIYYDATDF